MNVRAERRPDTLAGLQELLFVPRRDDDGPASGGKDTDGPQMGGVRLSLWLSRWRDHPLTCRVPTMHLEQYSEFWR